ncbi:MAG: MATE family efflux transporter [Tissierellia bacterium]|nr:MATE family efflux transporter [Tissierellia bacterium]
MKRIENNMIVEGNIVSSLIRYLMPILLGALFQQSYSLIDALIIGNFAGASGLAAIDAPYVYIKLLINTFLMLSSGSAIIVAQQYGAEDDKNVHRTVNIMILFSIITGFIIGLVGIGFASKFSALMLIPKEIHDMSVSYLRVYFSGSVFIFVYNMAAGSLRAIGDSKKPFYYLVISSVLNIFLDLIFVAVLKLGVGGAAFATVISQAFSAVLVTLRMRKSYGFFKFSGFKFSQSKRNLIESLRLGFPMAMQAILFSIANIYMQRGINSYGTGPIAGWSICGKSDFLIWTLSETFGIALCTFVAQNFGAKKYERMKKSLIHSLWIGSLSIIIVSLILYFFIQNISMLFTRDMPSVDNAVRIMKRIAPFYIFYTFSELFAGAIKGRGQTFAPMMITLLGTCLCRIGWIKIIVPIKPGIETVIMGYPISWVATALIMFIFYLVYDKKYKFAK